MSGLPWLMDTRSNKCKNCGADAKLIGDILKCPYCGSTYNLRETKEQTAPASVNPRPEYYPIPANDTGAKNRTQGRAVAFIVVVIVIILIIALAAIIKDTNGQHTGSYADSTNVDSSTIIKQQKADSVKENIRKAAINKAIRDSLDKSKVEALASISVDAATFKKLYRTARKKFDQFSNTTDIYDASSPQFIDMNGFFIYIDIDKISMELRLKAQYTAQDWLFIKTMTINADGENLSGFGRNFEKDNGNGLIWEWSDETVSDYNLSDLAKIANSKKAKIKYDGEQYYNVVNITVGQKAALKRQLAIYKGLLLGYNKIK